MPADSHLPLILLRSTFAGHKLVSPQAVMLGAKMVLDHLRGYSAQDPKELSHSACSENDAASEVTNRSAGGPGCMKIIS